MVATQLCKLPGTWYIGHVRWECLFYNNTPMEVWSLIGKVKSHSEDRRRSVEVGTRLGAGVEAEGVVAEQVSKPRSLVDRRHSRRS